MNIVITGTSRGIGFELLKILSEEHSVYALTSNPVQLKSKLKGISCHVLSFDFLSQELTELDSLLPTKIDIIINNAGKLLSKPLNEFDLTESEQIFKVNFHAPMQLIRSSIERLKKSEVAHVVNIGSMGGFQGSSKYPGLSVYSASKAALACLTECLAAEFANQNIRFNCLALGAVQTEMLSNAFPDYTAPNTPKEMAQFIADFALHQWRFFNGKILPVAISNP